MYGSKFLLYFGVQCEIIFRVLSSNATCRQVIIVQPEFDFSFKTSIHPGPSVSYVYMRTHLLPNHLNCERHQSVALARSPCGKCRSVLSYVLVLVRCKASAYLNKDMQCTTLKIIKLMPEGL